MVFYAKNLHGLLEFTNKRALYDYLLSQSDYKGEYVVDISKAKSTRSLDQNALYWSYLAIIEKETGNLSTDLHELFKRKFLIPVNKSILGIEFKIPNSTTELSKTQFGEYLDKISAFTEIPIPEPIKKEFEISIAYPKEEYKPKF